MQDQAPYDYEHTKDIETREKTASDNFWCSQPYVAETLKEIQNTRKEIFLRRALEMSGQTAPNNLTPYLISTIIGMTGGEHHCIGISRDECIGDGSNHVCRGLVLQNRQPSVWTIFSIHGEHFDDAQWRRDDVQY